MVLIRMELSPLRVENFLHQRIPLAKALDCQVVEVTHKCLKLTVPKAANMMSDDDFSDVGAATLCQLASWAFLQVSLQRLNYKPYTTLSQASWSKRREIDSNSNTLSATCSLPGDKEWQQFLRMLSRKARASAHISAVLSDEMGELATLTCEYDTRDLDPV